MVVMVLICNSMLDTRHTFYIYHYALRYMYIRIELEYCKKAGKKNTLRAPADYKHKISDCDGVSWSNYHLYFLACPFLKQESQTITATQYVFGDQALC